MDPHCPPFQPSHWEHLRGQTPLRADVGEPWAEEMDTTPSSYSSQPGAKPHSQHGGEREGATDPKHRVAVPGKAWMCLPLPKSTSHLDSGFWARKSSLGSDGAFRAQERHPPACVCPSCLHGAAPPAAGKQWVYKYADGLLIRPWPPLGTSVPWRPRGSFLCTAHSQCLICSPHPRNAQGPHSASSISCAFGRRATLGQRKTERRGST